MSRFSCANLALPTTMRDLVVAMDDATSECRSMLLVDEEGTASSSRGVREVVASKGALRSLHTDKASHWWFTPEAGGKMYKGCPTQFGRGHAAARRRDDPGLLAGSPGRSERMFSTLRGRLPKA